MSVVPEGIYTLVSVATGTVAHLPGGSTTANTAVQGFAPSTSAQGLYQLWYLTCVDWSVDIYKVQSMSAGTFLTLNDGTGVPGTLVTTSAGNPSAVTQKWNVKKHPSIADAYVFTNQASKTVLDLAASGAADGTPLMGWSPTGGPNQAWKLQRISRSASEVAALVSRYSHIKINYDLDLNYIPVPREVQEEFIKKNNLKKREIKPGLYDRDAFAIASKAEFNATVADLIKARIPEMKVGFLYGIMYGLHSGAGDHRAYNFYFNEDMDGLRFFDPQEGNEKQDLDFHVYMALY